MSIPSKFVRINENIKFTNAVSTNMSSGTLNLSTGLTTGIILATTNNATNVSATNIVGTIVNADTYTGGSMSLSGNLNLAGTLTTVNITSTNISETNVSAGTVTATNINVTTQTIGTARITGSLIALGSSNTIGNVFTTGGSVGIGTTAPAYTLDVMGSFEVGTSSGSAVITSRTSGNAEQHFELAGGTTGGLNTTRFYSRGLDKTFGLFNVENTRTQMRIVTSTTVENDRLCLLEGGGNVGIGTNSPGSTLDIKGSSTWGITRIAPSTSGGESAIGFFALNDFTASGQATSGNWILGTGINSGGASNFNLLRNTTNIISVSTNGNVGIGTTSPVQTLDINGNTALTNPSSSKLFLGNASIGNARLNIRDLFNNLIEFQYITSTIGNISCFGSGQPGLLFNGGGGNNQLVLNSIGNVGIGTTSPTSRLHIANPTTLNTNNVVFEVGTTTDGGNSGWSALNFNGYYNAGEKRINTSKNRWRLTVDQRTTADALMFDTYNGTTLTNIMIMNSIGNVGIGTISPGYKLDVNGSLATNTMLIRDTSYSTTLASQVYNGNTWYVAIAPGILTNDATYIVSLTFTCGGNPWNIYTSFIHMIGYTNDNSTSGISGANVPTTTHANNGSDYQVKVRGLSASGSSGGIQFSVNSTPPSGSWTVKAYRII